jgi:hypothetical protein
VRGRLLNVDVLAGLGGGDRDQRVRVVRRGDRNGVDVVPLEQLAEVGVDVELVAEFLLESIGGLMEDLLIDVAQRDQVLMVVLDVALALAVEADLGDADVGRALSEGAAGPGQPESRT